MTDNIQVNGSQSLWFYIRCYFCWQEVKNTEAIQGEGDRLYCSNWCKMQDEPEPPRAA